ncbi:MAG TPA: hypothetical protein VE262_19580 [Blastocatellia bacterium]|nr:hypothetical protein [Blastocatellia bacterium]
MTGAWQKIIAIGEIVGGVLALSATVFAAGAGASKSSVALGAALDLLVLVAGVALWFRPATGIVLSEVAMALQSVQVFTDWFVWQYIAGAALLVQVIGGEIQWSGGLIVRHTFFQDEGSNGTGLGVNVIAIAAAAFLIVTRMRDRSAHPEGTA